MQCQRLANTPGQCIGQSPAMRKEKPAWERWPHCRLDHVVGTEVWDSGGRGYQAEGVSLCIWKQTERGEGDREGREPTGTRLPKSLDFIRKQTGEPLEHPCDHWLQCKENDGKAGEATWGKQLHVGFFIPHLFLLVEG